MRIQQPIKLGGVIHLEYMSEIRCSGGEYPPPGGTHLRHYIGISVSQLRRTGRPSTVVKLWFAPGRALIGSIVQISPYGSSRNEDCISGSHRGQASQTNANPTSLDYSQDDTHGLPFYIAQS